MLNSGGGRKNPPRDNEIYLFPKNFRFCVFNGENTSFRSTQVSSWEKCLNSRLLVNLYVKFILRADALLYVGFYIHCTSQNRNYLYPHMKRKNALICFSFMSINCSKFHPGLDTRLYHETLIQLYEIRIFLNMLRLNDSAVILITLNLEVNCIYYESI